jgi:plastocyanin
MRRLTTLLAASALIAAGCGSDDEPAADADRGEAVSGQQVEMKDIAFQPETIRVRTGETITWINRDSVQHDVVNVKEGQEPKSELFNEGQTYEFTPTEAGTIQYLCSVHPNMKGTVEVTDDASSATP